MLFPFLLLPHFQQEKAPRFLVYYAGNQKVFQSNQALNSQVRILPEKIGSQIEVGDFLAIKLNGNFVSAFYKDFPPFTALLTKRKLVKLLTETGVGTVISSASLDPDVLHAIDQRILKTNFAYERQGNAKFYLQPNLRLNINSKGSQFMQVSIGNQIPLTKAPGSHRDPRSGSELFKIVEKDALKSRQLDANKLDDSETFFTSFPFKSISFQLQSQVIHEGNEEFDKWLRHENDLLDAKISATLAKLASWNSITNIRSANTMKELQVLDPERFLGILKLHVRNMSNSGFSNEDSVREDLLNSNIRPVFELSFQFLGTDGSDLAITIK